MARENKACQSRIFAGEPPYEQCWGRIEIPGILAE